MSLKRSPLYERHVDLGAKLADFGGWDILPCFSGDL